jgi:hypothetical protein
MQWVDITQEFFTAANEIPIGSVRHTPYFDLFQGVCAIPIMSDQMDSGKELPPPTERGKWEEIPEMKMEDIVGAMDSLLQMLTDHLEGQYLPLTLFASIYVRKRTELKSEILKYFVSLLMASYNIIREIILDAKVSFAEDFIPDTYELDVTQEEVQHHDILHSLKECLDAGSMQDLFKNIDCIPSDGDQFKELLNAVIFRLEFMKEWYHVLKAMHELDHTTVAKRVQVCQEGLEKVESTLHLGSDPLMSLDVLFHRLLFPSQQLYPIKMDYPKACKQWKAMLSGIYGVSQLAGNSSFNTVLLDVYQFHRDHGNANILTRSHLFCTLLNENTFLGKELLRKELVESMSSFYSIPYDFLRPSTHLEELLSSYHDFFSDLLKILCLERGRQRRQLVHLMNRLHADQQRMLETETSLHRLVDSKSEVFCFSCSVLFSCSDGFTFSNYSCCLKYCKLVSKSNSTPNMSLQ